MLYHELALLANFAVLWWMQSGQVSHVAICTFALLWCMRLSAKLNLFFGVPQNGAQYLPDHLKYLASYFRTTRGMSLWFVLSMGVAMGTWFWLVWLAQQGAVAITTGWVMLATLLGLAIVEHVIMIFPWPLERLWGWAMGPDHQTGFDHTPLKAPMNTTTHAYRTEGFGIPVSPQGPELGTPSQLRQRPVAVVIGSGFGGLAAAIRLSVKGYDVKVFEKLDAPGGRAYVHHQDGFTFDAGPTIITAPFLLEELWALCGKSFAGDVKLVAMDPFYRVRFSDGTWFDYNGDPEHMRAEVARFEPDDLPGYERFLEEAERCKTLGFEGMGDMAFDKVSDLMAAIPDFLRMGAWRSLYSLVAKHMRNDKLRIVMSFHPLLIGGKPLCRDLCLCAHQFAGAHLGVHSAMGGTGAIVKGLVGLLQERGVPLRCNAPVTQIRIENGRACGVELQSGEFVPADIVVSNGDTAWTYKTWWPPSTAACGPTARSLTANTPWACLSGTSAPPNNTKTCRTT